MRKIFYILISFFLLSIQITPVEGVTLDESQSQHLEIQAKRLDPKAEILAAYLSKHKSPLEAHAQDFVDAANLYNLDWKLVVSIAGVESTFGKHIPGGYNGWGWGIYGTNRIYFKSWEDGIYTVSKGLRENYVNKGYTEPYSMNRIYAASPTWGSKVTFFMNDIEKFSKEYTPIASQIIPAPRIAAVSGIIAQ